MSKPTIQRTDPFGPRPTPAAEPEVAGPHSPEANPDVSTTHPQLVYCGAHDTKNPIPCQVWFQTRTVLPIKADEIV